MKQRKNKEVSSQELCQLVAKGMMEKKAQDVAILDLRNVKNAVADYFVICSGSSDTQIDAIADSIEEEVYKTSSIDPWHKEGKVNREWILIDYVDVVAHVFKKDRRKYYDLEELWGDAELTIIEESVA
ncbi:ribosome silencing factor [Telluribacter humicola]|uniref:ribosome silencing factor n=1 Tax=Telluribacter humicola TaxID=1720261 RepID=UPI001A956596|nr:ribosome silencing factor [Telluribacter humicola]